MSKQSKAEKENELEERRRKIETLKAEAKSFGVYITSDRLNEISRVVNKLRADRAGKPNCYWRSYDQTAKECRICEIRYDCARGEKVPAEVPIDELKPVACRKCGQGQLEVELRDPESDEVRDYGCTNQECTGTLSEQTRHVIGEEEKPKPKPRAKIEKVKQKKGDPLGAELEQAILAYIAEHPGKTTRDIVSSVRGSATRKLQVLQRLAETEQIKREQDGRRYTFWPAGTP